MDDLSGGRRAVVDELDLEFFEASIFDDEALSQAAAGCDAIVHLTALGSVPRRLTVTPLLMRRVL